MKVNSLHIKNFRSIKDSGEIPNITKIFALIGRNNAGKSSFLKGVQALFAILDIQAQDFHKDVKEPIEISGSLLKEVDGKLSETQLKIVCPHDSLEIQYYIDGKKQTTKAAYKKNLPELLCISDIRNPSESKAGGSKQTLLNRILKLSNAADKATIQRYEELSNEIRELKEKEAKQASDLITAKFQSVLNEEHYSISISPTIEIEDGVSYHTGLEDTNVSNAKVVDIMNSGTGLQSMYILTLLEVLAEFSKKSDEAILVVEEPEVYLHPEYQRRMFAALRRIAENNQVFFTTHSPIMIADIWLTESVRQVRLNDQGETQIEKVKIEDVINELGIRYEDVLNPKLVLFVEGVDDKKFYTKLLGLEDGHIKIIPSDKFRAIHHFAFIKIMTSENVKSSFAIIADSDGESTADRKTYLKGQTLIQFNTAPAGLEQTLDDRILVLEKYEIESYFLAPDILSSAFPALGAEELSTFLGEYEAKYSEKQSEVQARTFSLENFQRNLKPKKIFEFEEHENAEKAYQEFWKDSPNFLKVRNQICELSKTVSQEGRPWFDHVLSKTNLDDPELIAKKTAILAFVN